MRVVRLCVLGFLAYVISMLVLFPLSPIVAQIEPHIAPVKLAGVNGKIYSGTVDSVMYDDGLLPLEFSNVAWSLSPGTLLKGGTGARISYQGYGGGGEGQVLRKWDGNIALSDFTFDAQTKEFESLLPIPGLASFTGQLSGSIAELVMENQLLELFTGKFQWVDASVTSDFFSAQLGELNIDIEPTGEKQHVAEVNASGGEIELAGSIDMTQNGDFSADILITPTTNTSSQLINNLRRFARPESGGRYRYTQKGNVNRLL
ncbi:MAG: type II secretion system protein N [Gammaproteobacteria bacterium]|nr:type II secretion system protein N [Gammaproteobacteria bacterium]